MSARTTVPGLLVVAKAAARAGARPDTSPSAVCTNARWNAA